jgi:glutathionylspermidine amidase/synthetase
LLIERRSEQGTKFAPYSAIVGIASSNVPAYSNGNDTYYSNENSFLNGIYMGLKWQCVEYARRWTYIRRSSIFESVEGANDMWNQLKYIERVSDKAQFPLRTHANGSPNPPINESYLIYQVQKDMPYGHVAVIVDVLPNAIRVAEQNFYFYYWPYNYARQIPVEFINGLYYIKDQYEVYGWMEIDDNQELIPLEQYAGKSIDIGNQRNLNSASAFHLLNIRIYFYYFLLVFLFIFYYMFC